MCSIPWEPVVALLLVAAVGLPLWFYCSDFAEAGRNKVKKKKFSRLAYELREHFNYASAPEVIWLEKRVAELEVKMKRLSHPEKEKDISHG